MNTFRREFPYVRLAQAFSEQFWIIVVSAVIDMLELALLLCSVKRRNRSLLDGAVYSITHRFFLFFQRFCSLNVVHEFDISIF